jgi:hypothetical protein
LPRLAARAVEHHADEQRLELHGHLGQRGGVVAMRTPLEVADPFEIDGVRGYA